MASQGGVEATLQASAGVRPSDARSALLWHGGGAVVKP